MGAPVCGSRICCVVFRCSAHAHDARGPRIERPRQHQRDRKPDQNHRHHGLVGPNETPGIPALPPGQRSAAQPRSPQRRGTRDGASVPATSRCYPCCPRVRNIISRVLAGTILAYDSRSFRCFSCRGWATRRRPRGGLFEGWMECQRAPGRHPTPRGPANNRPRIAACDPHADPRWFAGAQRAFFAMAQACCRKAAIRHLVTAVSKGSYSVGTHSMRRTKASLIYRRTKNLRAVQLLRGHTKLESALRYLGIDVDDATEMAEQTELRPVVGSSLGRFVGASGSERPGSRGGAGCSICQFGGVLM